ncbi:hypothetical protein EVAR_75282_1 [Eumeta japonica]|uniref:Uncharacterized protein n=1 Tax=Eumeta variegata TaxID=151549 RepID=A0A4C1YXE4_EUMVA|nr:hypothetical protein EVAR_75282_1 [Eumeta japonica]
MDTRSVFRPGHVTQQVRNKAAYLRARTRVSQKPVVERSSPRPVPRRRVTADRSLCRAYKIVSRKLIFGSSHTRRKWSRAHETGDARPARVKETAR